MALISHPRPI